MYHHHRFPLISSPLPRASRARLFPTSRLLACLAPLLFAVGGLSAHAANIVVNSTADPAGYNPSIIFGTLGTTVTLRDAVNAANNTAGDDTNTFDPALAGQTITLQQQQILNTAIQVTSNITIDGPAGGVIVSRSGISMRHFRVAAGVQFALDNLTLRDGNIADDGGSIYTLGTLTTSNVTFGVYPIAITASNGVAPNATQNFTLTVAEALSLTVTTASDVMNNTDNQTSLREAIVYANSLSGAQTITIPPGLGVITLSGDLPILTNPGGITIDGGSTSNTTGFRVFFVGVAPGEAAAATGYGSLVATTGTNWAINNLTIRNANARGGSGGGGGIFVNAGHLSVSGVSFSNNRAIGGDGGVNPKGGGGMGGNGGSAVPGGGGGGFGIGADGGGAGAADFGIAGNYTASHHKL